jgi:hypothetical protein
MMIEDQTLEIKVYNHNDAIIFVYENRHEPTGEKTKGGSEIHKHWQNVVTAIPVNFSYPCEVTDEEKYELVKNVADSLSALYQHETDNYEMGVSFYINHAPYING